MEALANEIAIASAFNRGDTLDDSLLDAAVKRSVELQELMLDRPRSPSGPRRTSVSSLDSALTELTDSEDGGSELSFGSTLSELTDTDDDATAPSEIPRRSTASPPSAGINAPGKAQGIAKVISVASDHERGQKRRKMEPDVTEQRVGKKIRAGETSDAAWVCHQGRRMKGYQKVKQRQMSKKTRTGASRAMAAFKDAIRVPCEFNDLGVSVKPKHERRVYRHEELEPLGVRTVEWDGRGTIPILTSSGVLLALLSGRPGSPSWDVRMDSLAHAMTKARRKISRDKKGMAHRRGEYHCVGTGLSLGGGSKKPGELRLPGVARKNAVAALRAHPSLKSLSGYVVSAMSLYLKELTTFCERVLDAVELQNPQLRRPFSGSPFGSLTFNFGPRVRTVPHKDFKNLSWGWCSVTSLGSYDPARGGHLVLWDLGIAVEFPPNSTIFIPSAIVEHSNTEIQENEVRHSVTQYTSAGLFRWCAYGFRLKSEAVRLGIRPAGWWSHPRHMFPKAPREE